MYVLFLLFAFEFAIRLYGEGVLAYLTNKCPCWSLEVLNIGDVLIVLDPFNLQSQANKIYIVIISFLAYLACTYLGEIFLTHRQLTSL